jgi:Fe-coproporphyrin III synthase
MCDIWRATGKSEIGVGEIDGWAEEWLRLGVRRLALSGGEALMHQDIEGLCRALHARGIGVTVMTTGLLLERHAGWLPRYVDDVIVSLDGPERVHNAIRNVPSAFERLKRGIAGLRSEGPQVAISGRCVVQRSNYRHLVETVGAAREIGLQRISFLAADVSSEAFNRPGGWDDDRSSSVALGVEDLSPLEYELGRMESECAAEFAEGFISESPAKLRARLLDYFRAVNGISEFPALRCNAPWVSCVIEADATVRPCFFQPAYGSLRGAEGLDSVLNSPDAIAFRQRLDVRTDPICKRCVCTLALQDA